MMQYKQLEKLIETSEITKVCFDSRKIIDECAFVAIKGEKSNGNDFIDLAIKAGAKIIITDDLEVATNYENDKIIYVENSRIALSVLAGSLYPKLPKHLIAAVGTNGKTSLVSYCRQLYKLFNKNSASIGTIGLECDYKDFVYQDCLTTSDPLTLRSTLHTLAINDVNYVAFEASSHGLDQERLYGIKVSAAAFTSFSQDHLDYHKTMDNYLLAKLKLFKDNLLPKAIVVINSEIAEFNFIKSFLLKHGVEFLTVGINGDIKIDQITQSLLGQEISFSYEGVIYNFHTEIISSVQVTNLLTAALLVHKTGFEFEDVIMGLSKVKAVTGRLERVTDKTHPFHVFVDYAHTPDALKNSLSDLKEIKPKHGKLKVIFGCGGDRDKSKRPQMGEIASEIADEVIITDDNPRNEDPNKIRKEILSKAFGAKEIEGRKEAIISVINELAAGDILLIAGKGHEDYQIIGDTKIAFSDAEIARETIKKL